MRIAKQVLVQVLYTQGDRATAQRAAESLPEEIDTERDRELLSRVGLDHDRLSAHLAAAAVHPIG